MVNASFGEILEALHDSGVEFVVVGGLSAVLQGAPITTIDLDIVHNCSAENVARLHSVLKRLNAYYRIRPDLKRCPEPRELEQHGQHLLSTDMGLLDVLGKLASGETFAELASNGESIRIGSIDVRVQSLESLIHVKEILGSEKDLAVLPTLRSTLEEKKRLDR